MISVILKTILKIILLPVIAVLTLVKWIGIFLTSFSTLVFYILSGLFLLCGVLSWLMGISTEQEAMAMVITAFIVFVIPSLMEWITVKIGIANARMRKFIRS